MRLIFVRHAEPDYGCDSLTAKGRLEAELLSRRLARLNVTAFYTSPLGRAKDTAAPTLRRMQRAARVLPWLAEFRGRFFDEERGRDVVPWDLRPRFYQAHPGLADRDAWMNQSIFDGSTVQAIWQESCDGLNSLLAEYGYIRDGWLYRCDNNQPDTLVLFCHFGIATALVAYLAGISPVALWQGFCMQPSAVTTLITEERVKGEVVFRCMQFGDLSHLYAADEPYSTAALFAECYDGRDSTEPASWSAPPQPEPELFV